MIVSRNPLLFPILAAMTFVSACSSGDNDAAPGAAASATPSHSVSGASSDQRAPQFTSDVAALAIDAISQLPKAPASAQDQADCAVVIPVKSAAARLVADAGWGVTAEERIGRFQAVSFAGSFESATSGSCYVGQGNVALFDGDRLRAIVYARPGSKTTIGRIEPFDKAGLRIWDGDIVPRPVADIRLAGTGLAVVELAAQEQTCGGVVPRIDSMPITKARAALIGAGWKPVDHGAIDQRTDPREQTLVKMGVVEVDSCSGTGFGYCGFDYRRPGAALSVTTVGESGDPVVSYHSVQCRESGD